METFKISGLTFSYPERSERALDGLDLTVKKGEFLVICGPSGCGKSTLLRLLKPVLAPHGTKSGSILFEGRPLDELDQSEQSRLIGFVQQSPEDQIVTDKVWHELAFGLESLGADTPTIRRRVAEMASFFGGRVATLLVEEAILAVFITWLGLAPMPVKIVAQVAVIVANYFISKFFVFKK